MATRQYIGARYVPKFFSDENGSSQWRDNIPYEALTIVTNLGNSYTSKKPVPVGVQIDNGEYWVLTGAFNQQVEEYREEVARLIDVIEGNGVIIIGDSYGVDASSGGKSWATIVEENISNCYRITVGGTGFGSDVYITNNWLNMLQSLNIAEKDKIKNIIILGGGNDANLINDGRLTENTLRDRISAFMNYCKLTYPNAKVKVAFVAWYKNSSRFNTYELCSKIYSECSKYSNGEYYANGETIMHNTANINDLDLIHPTQKASDELGKFALSIIQGGYYNYTEKVIVNVVGSEGVSVGSLSTIHGIYDNSTFSVNFLGNYANTYIQVKFSNPLHLTYGYAFEIANLTNTPLGSNFYTDLVTVNCQYGHSGSTGVLPFMFLIQNGKLLCRYVGAQDDLTISVLNIPPFNYTLDLRYN